MRCSRTLLTVFLLAAGIVGCPVPPSAPTSPPRHTPERIERLIVICQEN
jgi:hypothetical protein